jgi:hypothetical protein
MRISYLPSKGKITQVTEWTKEVALNSSSWTQVWSKSNIRFELHCAFFQLNSDKVLFKVTNDSSDTISLDLEEISKSYKMSYAGGHHAEGFPLFEYSANLWRYAPPMPDLSNSGLSISLKMTTGSGELVRGLAFWSPA